MSEVIAELATRLRLSDPKPAHCSACLCSSGEDVRFVDFDAMVDRGSFVDPDGAMHVTDSMEELHLCESCVRQAMEVLDFRPERHRKLLIEYEKERVEKDHWKGTARRLKRELDAQLDSGLGPSRRGRRT